jgi:hypothetical protein
MNKTYKGRSRKWFIVSPKGWARRVDLDQFCPGWKTKGSNK